MSHPPSGDGSRRSLFGRFRLILLGLALASPTLGAQTSGTLNGLANDAQINLQSGATSVANQSISYCRVGGSNGAQHCSVYVFQIPNSIISNPATTFSAATFTIKNGSNTSTVTGDLYGLPYRTSATVQATQFYEGTADPNAAKVQGALLSSATTSYATISTSATALKDYLNAQLAAARTAGSTSVYVYLRINPTAVVSSNNFFVIAMAEAGGTNIPTLTYTTTTASSLLFYTDYDRVTNPLSPGQVWGAEQEPSVGGVLQTSRMTVTAPPGDPADPDFPPTKVMRVELRPYNGGAGDVQAGTYNRAEVYGRRGNTDYRYSWPDCSEGSERWYSWSTYIPTDWVDSASADWVTIVQWKGAHFQGIDTGSPPMAMEIKQGTFEFNPPEAAAKTLGSLNKGQWTRFVVGIKYSTSSTTGWYTVYKDGVLKLGPTMAATLPTDPTYGADLIYLKQGIYRATAHTTTNVLYHGPMKIGLSYADVAGDEVPVMPTLINDNSAAITYAAPATWDYDDVATGNLGNDQHYSLVTNNKANLWFTSTQVRWIGTKGPDGGIANIFVDDVFAQAVDQYAPTVQYQQPLYTRSSLSYGPHRIRVEVKGAKNSASTSNTVDVDAFQITP